MVFPLHMNRGESTAMSGAVLDYSQTALRANSGDLLFVSFQVI
jgi:hypothetical protein